MRRALFLAIPLLISGSLAEQAGAGGVRAIFAVAGRVWWAVPLSASVASILVLVLSTGFGSSSSRKKNYSLSTTAYLVVGPSFAALNLLPMLAIRSSPPAWVEYLMLLILLCSAIIYYRVARDSDGEPVKEHSRPGFILEGASVTCSVDPVR